MYFQIQKYVLIVMILFFAACGESGGDKSSDDNTKNDSETLAQERVITTTQEYKTGYYTSFIHQNGNNLFEDSAGTLHIAFVDNYELYYAKSTDGGESWSKEKITTGHEGALRRASLTVDTNKKVYIGFITHNKFNYADDTNVTYGTNFEYDMYCATNKSGSWSIELLYTHENGTTGREVAGLDIDADNNVHLFATYYGWWSYGGRAYEYIRYANSDTWSTETKIAEFSDASVDRFIYGYFRTHIKSNGDITLVSIRNGNTPSTDDKLFYVKKESGTWGTPVDLVTLSRENPRTNHFDSAVDKNNHIYLAYVKDDTDGTPKIYFSTDFGTASAIHSGNKGEVIHGIKLHSNEDGDLTLLVNNDTNKSVLLTKKSTADWSSATELDTQTTKGVVYNVASVRTNTAKGVFTDFKMSYLERVGTISSEKPNGPFTLYFYKPDLTSDDSSSNDTTDNTQEPNDDTVTNTNTQIVVSHMGGVDFSTAAANADWEDQDGYATTWPSGATYVDGEEYGSGLWYSNNVYDTTNTYTYIQSFGDVSLDSITSVDTTKWLAYNAPLQSLQIGHVYVVKTRDGYAKFKVISIDTTSSDWSFTAEYKYSSTTSF